MSLKKFIALFALTAGLALLLYRPEMLTLEQTKTAALVLVTIVFWATGIIPEYITSLLFFLAAMIFSVSSAKIVFAGFSSAAIWLIFSGLIIGIAITASGLGRRVADRAAVGLHGSYLRIISGLVGAGILFSFLMPSAMGRVVLLTPIAIAIASHFGFAEGSNGRTGVLLAVILGTFIPAFGILPANVPNMVLIGMAETQFQTKLLFGPYLLLHFPVLGLLKAVIIIGIITWLYPDRPLEKSELDLPAQGPMSRKERTLTIVLILMLIFWMSDFLHHISPAWIALAGAVFIMFPGIAIVGKKEFNQKINWASIIFVAGILGLGGIINQSGLGSTLATKILALLPLSEGQDFLNFVGVGMASALTGIATTLPGVPAVFTPLSDTIAQTTGLPIQDILMLQVLGFSTVIFPYQAPPIVIGMQLSGESFASAARVCLVLALITLLFLLPVNYFWWHILGII